MERIFFHSVLDPFKDLTPSLRDNVVTNTNTANAMTPTVIRTDIFGRFLSAWSTKTNFNLSKSKCCTPVLYFEYLDSESLTGNSNLGILILSVKN